MLVKKLAFATQDFHVFCTTESLLKVLQDHAVMQISLVTPAFDAASCQQLKKPSPDAECDERNNCPHGFDNYQQREQCDRDQTVCQQNKSWINAACDNDICVS